MLKKAALLTFMLGLAATLSACNTARGFGEDVQHLGGAISRAAD